MFKYLLALIIVVVGFKSFYALEDYLAGSPSTVDSQRYRFHVVFPSQYNEEEELLSSAQVGEFKLVTYFVKSPELNCSVAISDYLGNGQASGDFYDLIEASRRKLLKGYKGTLEQGEFIDNGAVTGYEFNMKLKNNKLLRSQVYKYKDNAYKLSCQFKNDSKYQNAAYDFMHSFTFT